MRKKTLFILLLVILTSCSSFKINNKKYRSVGKDNRIKFIVMHYTAGHNHASIKTLVNQKVSSHYLITKDKKREIYSLVDDHERAWHAGDSSFLGRKNINDTSIGIEIVNEGIYKEYRVKYEGPRPYEHYVDFDDIQIKKTAFLLKELIKKYDVKPKCIIAHSDVAPQRKLDPGPKFPWKKLYYDYGIGAWYEEADKEHFKNEKVFKSKSVKELKKELEIYGYEINDTEEWDKESKKVVYAFQMHFSPNNLSGVMDLETYAILKALNYKYSK